MLEGASAMVTKETEGLGDAESKEELAKKMTREVLYGLRSFLNDECNELEYALNIIGEHFLRPETGVIILVSRCRSEERIAKEVSAELPRVQIFPESIIRSGECLAKKINWRETMNS